ncbi:hypothetical protein GCM10007036_10990 [Alsobacter metallidurans]|uniref:Uncharacterized protein n=1 Tax=Alsobacter metallidurans TaxID=340221 RepID=A0A917MH42_9HYPH|nr:hypothetical protein [Alsobacter metallidurans]GGH12821.1 hypothetical protein GCM10007036_10990 [Alsobacter metallidurans]
MRRKPTDPSSSSTGFDKPIAADGAALIGQAPEVPGHWPSPLTGRDVVVALTASAIWAAVFAVTSLTASHDGAATPAAMTTSALAMPTTPREDRSSFERAYSAGATYQYWPCGDPACDQ